MIDRKPFVGKYTLKVGEGFFVIRAALPDRRDVKSRLEPFISCGFRFTFPVAFSQHWPPVKIEKRPVKKKTLNWIFLILYTAKKVLKIKSFF